MRRLLQRIHQQDDGYSLSELLVVIALMGMVLAIAYNVNYFVSRASAQNVREARFGTEVRSPLMYIDKLLMQNNQIEGVSGDDMISFFTDIDLDDVRERNVIRVDGSTLTLNRWNVSGTNANIGGPIQTLTFSTNNANLAQGVPLFTYIDSDGVTITNPDDYAGSARSIRTTIVVDYDGHVFSDSRQTFLRNRE